MNESDDNIRSPVDYDHPWGGTVIRTKVNQPTYEKVVSERFVWDVLDFSNAIAVHVLNKFSERVSQATKWLTDEIDDSVFVLNGEAVSNFFLVHTLSSAVFEASSYLLFTEPLCYVDSQKASDIIDYFDEGGERSWFKVKRASDQEEKRIEAIKRIQDSLKPNQYLNLLEEYIEIDSKLLEQIQELYKQRGSIVHDLMGLIETDWEEVKTTAKLWEMCVTELVQVLENKLEIHQGLYQGLQN